MKPLHRHPCKRCIYLGTKGEEDHYFCPANGEHLTIDDVAPLPCPRLVIRTGSTYGMADSTLIEEVRKIISIDRYQTVVWACQRKLISKDKADQIIKDMM